MTQEWHLSRPPVARFQHLYDGARAPTENWKTFNKESVMATSDLERMLEDWAMAWVCRWPMGCY